MNNSKFLRWRNRILSVLIPVALCVLLTLDLMRPIHLITADIGRHIKNGELLLQGHTDLLNKNFYSYTHPDYPFINHHWFFGVISFWLWKVSGFAGLSLEYIALLLAALFLFLRAALLRGHYALVMLFLGLSLPLIVQRSEIRPEGLSIFFMGVYFYLLTKLSLGQIRRRILYPILIFAQLIWVNSHIFFFMGPILVAIFLWEGASRGCKICARHLRPLLFLTTAVNLINPSGIAGALTPLNTFKEFGYRLAENQNVFFMMSYFRNEKVYPYYLVVLAIVLVGMVLAVWIRGWKTNAPFIFLTLFAALAGVKAVRLMSLFGFLIVPLGAYFWAQVEGQWPQKAQRIFRGVVLASVIGLGIYHAVGIKEKVVGIGLIPGANTSAEFFKQAGIKGPVFSNYDIGGYLIYHFEPKQKVFVDNRQEAFPPEFFKNVYVRMQEDNAVWQKQEAQYGFNAIYFYRHDMTPWGQDFLIKRVKDPEWAPVFVDVFTIIFLKRNAQNAEIIKNFELPQSMFGVTH